MKITLVCPGKIREKWLQEGVEEYVKRFSKYCKTEIIEVDVSGQVTKVVEEISPAVVTITAVIPGTMTWWGPTSDSTSMGSGV
ncbi:MAG: 23S rRNA (pseudouridine(1915)-N(3))-methyltransferase RlmH, partial [Clostridiales bacterium]|nr:23S rRNA (pseudouridine(1915)-N(3))-methyltransferase RlmH [Clostridiales bacterium]